MTAAQAGAAPARSGVRYPPPLAFAIPFVVAWLLDRVNPMPLVGPDRRLVISVAGTVLGALGIGLASWAARTFRRAGTAVNPFEPSTALVQGGPFRFTRNPMYIGLTVLYLGLTLLVNSFWPVMLLPISLAAITLTVIRREERYLSSKFGAAYDDYRRRVRRWL